jgi:hypothetical protein
MKIKMYILSFAVWVAICILASRPIDAGIVTITGNDNGAASATQVSTFDCAIDIVGPNDQFDWYIIDTGAGYQTGGDITVTCFEPGLAVRLYQRVGGTDTQISEKSTSANITRIIFDAYSLSLLPGTFLVRVTYYSANPVDHKYHISFGIYSEGCNPDTNDNAAAAYELSLGTSVADYICADDPSDWYKLRLTSADDGAVLALVGDIGSINLKVMSGLTKPATQVFRGSAGGTYDALFIIDMNTLSKGDYYAIVEIDPSDTSTHAYSIYYATRSYLGLSSESKLPNFILGPKGLLNYDWEKNYPWEKTPPIDLGPWPRIGGNPANNDLTAYTGPNSPQTIWEKELKMTGSVITIDALSLLTSEGKVTLDDLLRTQIPSLSLSLENSTPEPLLDSANGIIIASGTKDYGDFIKKVTVYGVDINDGAVLWSLNEVSSNGQLLLGPNGTFLTPGGGTVGLTGDTGISCVSTGLGKALWSVDSPRTTIEINALDETRFVASDGETIRAYFFDDGSVSWSWSEKGKPAPRSLATDGLGNTFGNIGGYLYKFDSSGTRRYRAQVAPVEADIPVNSKTIIGPSGKVFMSDSRGTIYCCKGSDGSILWTYPPAGTKDDKALGIDLGGITIGGVELKFGDLGNLGSALGNVGDIIGETKNILKMFKKLDLAKDLAMTPNGYLVAAFRKRIIVLDTNGKLIAERKLDQPIGSGITIDGAGVIYIGTPKDDGTYCIEAMDHTLTTIWSVDNLGTGSRLVIDSNGLCYHLSGKNMLYCIG